MLEVDLLICVRCIILDDVISCDCSYYCNTSSVYYYCYFEELLAVVSRLDETGTTLDVMVISLFIEVLAFSGGKN